MSRQYPELARALETLDLVPPPVSKFLRSWPLVMLGLFALGAVTANPWILAGGVAIWVGAGITEARVNQKKRRGTREDVVERFKKAIPNLDDNLDPVAGQILEACALHRKRILAALEASVFSGENASAYWKEFARKAKQAASDGFERALLTCDPYLGTGRKKRRLKGGLEMALRDLIKGDFEDGLERILRLGEEEDRDERRRRDREDQERVPSALRPAYQVALKLKHLAAEVERTAMQSAEADAREQREGGDSLDIALLELASIRKAEEELDQTQIDRA